MAERVRESRRGREREVLAPPERRGGEGEGGGGEWFVDTTAGAGPRQRQTHETGGPGRGRHGEEICEKQGVQRPEIGLPETRDTKRTPVFWCVCLSRALASRGSFLEFSIYTGV